jgi:hypothetical protein
MTPVRVSIIAAIAAIVLLVVIFELIRSRRLQERYAMLWLFSGTIILVLAVWRRSGRNRLSAVGAVRPVLVLHPAASLALLDSDLAAVRPESDPCAAARSARKPPATRGVGSIWRMTGPN